MQTELSTTLPSPGTSPHPDSDARTPPAASSNNSAVWLRPLLELVVVVGSLELILFPLHDSALKILVPIPVVVLLCVAVRSTRRTGRTVRPAIVRGCSARLAWGRMLLLSAIGGLLFVGMVEWLELLPNADSKLASRGVTHWLIRKFPTVVVQQVGLQLFVLPACFEIFRRRWIAVGVSAALFALVHLPNLPLMALTFCSGAVWCSLYLRTGRVVPLIVSHLALAVLAAELAGHSLYHMRVGAGCLKMLPWQIDSKDGRSFTVVPESLVGCMDACRSTTEGFVCRGWVLDRRCTASVDGLFIVIDGSVHRFDLSGHRHRHKAAADMYGTPEQELCGFELVLPDGLMSGAESIEFFGEAGDGAVSRINPPPNMRSTDGGYQFD
jgi:membrane protease YdiL (CAAX protease family)